MIYPPAPSQSLEAEIAAYLTASGAEWMDFTDSTDKPDFAFHSERFGWNFFLEVKEKRQRVNLQYWVTPIPERHLFILDDLTVRKLLYTGWNSGVGVRDNLTGRYVFYSLLHLLEIPKSRANRAVGERGVMKGKWLIDLRHGEQGNSVRSLFVSTVRYMQDAERNQRSLGAWGSFWGENLSDGGTQRSAEQRQGDFAATR